MTKAVKALVIIGAVFAPWLAAFLTTAPMLSLRAHAAQGDFLKLTVGYTPIAGASLPFFIAVEEKSFQKYGLEVSPIFMGGSPLINSAILSGEFPIGYTGGGALMSSRLAGSDLIAIASPLPVLTIDGWARPEIKSVADLKGKRIGVTRFGASSYFAGLSMLESAGVKPSEVVFIQNGGVGESLAALLGGRVDVCMIGYPFGLRAKKEGFHLLFRPSDTEYGFFPTAVIAARESWLKEAKSRNLAINFLRALNEGQQLARENAEASKKALRKYTRVDNDAELQGSFEYYRSAFSSTLRTADKSMANALKFIDHPKAKGADVKQFYDNSLVDEAMK
ncbi:MAG TPA: ABC transporter substrate-binding protein [Verrucomicrobiae bacterium]|jgi:NitT/TauT family transport system substrate-binding protein|nr:ABC transporter substrate-binding protein [Verrucomicrobiae bacterium]